MFSSTMVVGGKAGGIERNTREGWFGIGSTGGGSSTKQKQDMVMEVQEGTYLGQGALKRWGDGDSGGARGSHRIMHHLLSLMAAFKCRVFCTRFQNWEGGEGLDLFF